MSSLPPNSPPLDHDYTLRVYKDSENPENLLGTVLVKTEQTMGELRRIIRKLGQRPAFSLFNGVNVLGPKLSRSRVVDIFKFPTESVAIVRDKIMKEYVPWCFLFFDVLVLTDFLPARRNRVNRRVERSVCLFLFVVFTSFTRRFVVAFSRQTGSGS